MSRSLLNKPMMNMKIQSLMRRFLTSIVCLMTIMLMLPSAAFAQSRIDTGDRRIDKQHRNHVSPYRTHDRRKTSDRKGLKSSVHSGECYLAGFWVDAGYGRLFHNVPDVKHLGGGGLSIGGLFEYESGYFMLQTGAGIAFRQYSDSVHDVFYTNQLYGALTTDIRWNTILDSYGVPVDVLYYSFTERKDVARTLSLQIPLLLGANFDGFYFLAGPKLSLSFWGQTVMKCNATSEADYSSRYIGMYGEMDNHGYRHNVPLKYTGPALWNIRFNIMASAEVGWEFYLGVNHLRIAAYADYGLLTLSPSSGNQFVSVPYDTKFNFETFTFNHVYTTAEAADSRMNEFSAGLKFTYFYEFPEQFLRVLNRNYNYSRRRATR